MANFASMAARLVDIFGTPSSADPTKLKGNLTVSPAGNVLVGTSTDDATNKFQVTGTAKYNANLTVNLDGSIWTAGTASTTGLFRTTGDIGGSFASWNASRPYAIQVDCANDASAYGGVRWTHPGVRHLAAIDAYAGGSGATAPVINMHIGTQTSAWSFSATGIVGTVGTVVHTGNFTSSGLPAYTANRIRLGAGAGGDTVWNWSGLGGQPTWLWGGTDGVNMYVYNPSNFSVNYATTAGSVGGITTPARAAGNAFTFQWDGSAGHVNITVDTTLVAYVAQNVSDVRLKENIEPIKQDSLALIEQVDFKTYDFKTGLHVNAGLVAQEVEQFAPQWVVEKDTGEYEDGRFLNTQEMLLSAMHAIQQLSAEVKALKEQLKAKE